jgi:hypothetical protein
MKTATFSLKAPHEVACGQWIATITFSQNGRTWTTPAAPGLTAEQAAENARALIRRCRAVDNGVTR